MDHIIDPESRLAPVIADGIFTLWCGSSLHQSPVKFSSYGVPPPRSSECLSIESHSRRRNCPSESIRAIEARERKRHSNFFQALYHACVLCASDEILSSTPLLAATRVQTNRKWGFLRGPPIASTHDGEFEVVFPSTPVEWTLYQFSIDVGGAGGRSPPSPPVPPVPMVLSDDASSRASAWREHARR